MYHKVLLLRLRVEGKEDDQQLETYEKHTARSIITN